MEEQYINTIGRINETLIKHFKEPNEKTWDAIKETLAYTDISIHFSPKFINIEDFDDKFGDFLYGIVGKYLPNTVLHHCFMDRNTVDEKGFPTDIVDYFDHIKSGGYTIKEHFTSLENINESREEMFKDLIKSFKPLCVFVGDIKDGVELEYTIAKKIGLEVIEL